jgi:serine/threonine protein kinase
MAQSKYKKEEELGRGNFGVVYRATERSSNKMVAIKEVEDFDPNSSVLVSIL